MVVSRGVSGSTPCSKGEAPEGPEEDGRMARKFGGRQGGQTPKFPKSTARPSLTFPATGALWHSRSLEGEGQQGRESPKEPEARASQEKEGS